MEVRMPNGRVDVFDEPMPFDKPMCSKFGAGAFVCGPPYKVQLITVQAVRQAESTRRRVLCRAHYEFFISPVKGGAGGLKSRVMTAAYQHLAAAHRDEFQQLYERELARALSAEVPDLDPSLVLPSTQES